MIVSVFYQGFLLESLDFGTEYIFHDSFEMQDSYFGKEALVLLVPPDPMMSCSQLFMLSVFIDVIYWKRDTSSLSLRTHGHGDARHACLATTPPRTSCFCGNKRLKSRKKEGRFVSGVNAHLSLYVWRWWTLIFVFDETDRFHALFWLVEFSFETGSGLLTQRLFHLRFYLFLYISRWFLLFFLVSDVCMMSPWCHTGLMM